MSAEEEMYWESGVVLPGKSLTSIWSRSLAVVLMLCAWLACSPVPDVCSVLPFALSCLVCISCIVLHVPPGLGRLIPADLVLQLIFHYAAQIMQDQGRVCSWISPASGFPALRVRDAVEKLLVGVEERSRGRRSCACYTQGRRRSVGEVSTRAIFLHLVNERQGLHCASEHAFAKTSTIASGM